MVAEELYLSLGAHLLPRLSCHHHHHYHGLASASQVGLATLQELDSHTMPMATVLDRAVLDGEAEKKSRGFHVKW